MTNQVFNFNADFAMGYDGHIRKAMFAYEQWFALMLAMLTPDLGENANVLVVGCGTGMELVSFGSAMPGWRLTGVDPAERMIQITQAKLERENLSNRVRLHQGTLDSLPASELYDVATLVLVLHFLPDDGSKLNLLKDIQARLKPGGRLVLMDLGGDLQAASFQALLETWKNFQVQMGMPRERVETSVQAALETQHFIAEARVRELLAEVGFVQVERFYQALLNSGFSARKA